jgi:glycosyltransferase involved in cell wall biosynthesis
VPHRLDSAPSQRFRWEQWAPLLEQRGLTFEFVPFETSDLERFRRRGHRLRSIGEAASRYLEWFPRALRSATLSDVTVIHRNAALGGPPIIEYLLARLGQPLVYDLDDAIHLGLRGDTNPLARLARCNWRVDKISSWADLVTPGNSNLADYVGQFADHVEIVPTTVSTDVYQPTPVAGPDHTPTIGWSGSPSTAKYLEQILPVLERLRASYDFELLVMGADLDLGGLEGRCIPWSADIEVSAIQKMDIGLMPLPDNPWTRGKCALKAIQYLAVGSPAVVSDVGVNARAVPHEECGFVVDSEDEWLEALATLLDDHYLRAEMGRAGRSHVERNFSARAWVPTLERLLHDAADQTNSAAEPSDTRDDHDPTDITPRVTI